MKIAGGLLEIFLAQKSRDPDQCCHEPIPVFVFFRYLHVWEAETGRHLSSIMIHSVYKFPFAVSRTRNLVATGSNIHTAIKVREPLELISGHD